MRSLAFTPPAIENTWDHTAASCGLDQIGGAAAEHHHARVAGATGSKRSRAADVRHGSLKRSTGSHMIYPREIEDRVIVIRALHAKQDVGRHL